MQDVIVQHSLPLVSFSADVKRSKQEVFSYIAKTSPKAKEYICYAYEVPRGQVIYMHALIKPEFFFFLLNSRVGRLVQQ